MHEAVAFPTAMLFAIRMRFCECTGRFEQSAGLGKRRFRRMPLMLRGGMNGIRYGFDVIGMRGDFVLRLGSAVDSGGEFLVDDRGKGCLERYQSVAGLSCPGLIGSGGIGRLHWRFGKNRPGCLLLRSRLPLFPQL